MINCPKQLMYKKKEQEICGADNDEETARMLGSPMTTEVTYPAMTRSEGRDVNVTEWTSSGYLCEPCDRVSCGHTVLYDSPRLHLVA